MNGPGAAPSPFNPLYVPTSYPSVCSMLTPVGNSSPYGLSYQPPPSTGQRQPAVPNPSSAGYWSATATPTDPASYAAAYPPSAQIQGYPGPFPSWADTGPMADYHRHLPTFPTYVGSELRPWSNYNPATMSLTGQYNNRSGQQPSNLFYFIKKISQLLYILNKFAINEIF